jgi:hypothetical protein
MTKRKIEYWVIPPKQDAEFVAWANGDIQDTFANKKLLLTDRSCRPSDLQGLVRAVRSRAKAFPADSAVFSNASLQSRTTKAFSDIGRPRSCTLARLGATDLGAQTQLLRVLRSDTPTRDPRLPAILCQGDRTQFPAERSSASVREGVHPLAWNSGDRYSRSRSSQYTPTAPSVHSP